jgi:hypothetical protein
MSRAEFRKKSVRFDNFETPAAQEVSKQIEKIYAADNSVPKIVIKKAPEENDDNIIKQRYNDFNINDYSQ